MGRKEVWHCQKQILIGEGITKGRQLTKGHWRGQSDPSVQVIEEPENHSKHIQNRKATGRSSGDSLTLSIVELHHRNKARTLSIGCCLSREEAAFFLWLSLLILQLTDENTEWGVNEEMNAYE